MSAEVVTEPEAERHARAVAAARAWRDATVDYSDRDAGPQAVGEGKFHVGELLDILDEEAAR